MALPRKGDPRRPLHLAIRSTRTLGVVFLLVGTCALAPLMRGFGRAGSGAYPAFLFLGALVYLGVGGGFLALSLFLARRQFWAVVAALVLSSIVSLIWIAGGVGLLVSLVVAGGDTGPAMPIAVSVLVLLVAALGQLIFHLAKSFEAIKHPPFGQEARGFEPLLVPPATPVVIGPPILPPAPAQAGPDPADGRDTTYDPAARR